MSVKSSKTWSARCRPTAAELRLASSWAQRAVRHVERELETARHDPSIDAPALRSKLGKLKSGLRLLQELRRANCATDRADEPILIAGRDAPAPNDQPVDCVLGQVTNDSLAQIAAAMNANILRAHIIRGRRLRLLRRRDGNARGAGAIAFGWVDDTAGSASSKPKSPLRGPLAAARFSLVQYFNAGSFQAAYTTGAQQQAAVVGLTMNARDPADADMRTMIRRIDEAIADPRTRGLIVHSGAAVQLQPLLRRAHDAGKALVASHLVPAVPQIPSIVLDDVGTGRLLAEAMLYDESAASGPVEALLLGGGTGELVHMQLRQQGFLDAIRSSRSRAHGVRARTIDDVSLPSITEALRKSPPPRAIVAFYDDVSRYAAQAIEIAALADRVALYGVDLGDPEIEEMQARSFWRAQVAVDAFALGAAAVRILAAQLRDPAWAAAQRFPFVIPTILIHREQLLTLRDKTARGIARAFPELTRSADQIAR